MKSSPQFVRLISQSLARLERTTVRVVAGCVFSADAAPGFLNCARAFLIKESEASRLRFGSSSCHQGRIEFEDRVLMPKRCGLVRAWPWMSGRKTARTSSLYGGCWASFLQV